MKIFKKEVDMFLSKDNGEELQKSFLSLKAEVRKGGYQECLDWLAKNHVEEMLAIPRGDTGKVMAKLVNLNGWRQSDGSLYTEVNAAPMRSKALAIAGISFKPKKEKSQATKTNKAKKLDAVTYNQLMREVSESNMRQEAKAYLSYLVTSLLDTEALQ